MNASHDSRTRSTKYWLFKTEPEAYSIHDLAADRHQTTGWDGVRNYQARNMLRDEIRPGDVVFIYHSNADPPAIAGTAVVVREGYPDHTAWDPNDPHYDPRSSREDSRWFMVDVKLQRIFPRPLPLSELRTCKPLWQMELLRKGSALSIQPVRPKEFEYILRLASGDERLKGGKGEG